MLRATSSSADRVAQSLSPGRRSEVLGDSNFRSLILEFLSKTSEVLPLVSLSKSWHVRNKGSLYVLHDLSSSLDDLTPCAL
jgi:hypothetical protein